MNQIRKFSLADLLNIVKRVFDQSFFDFVFYVECKVSRVKLSNNYLYLELVEYEVGTQGQTKAKARGVIFKSQVVEKFKKVVGYPWTYERLTRFNFIFRGKLNFHQEYGFSIVIDDFTYQTEETVDYIIEKLRKEKILDKNKCLGLPYPPFRIAIISSPTSEGLKDFLTILNESGYKFYYEIYPSEVHGNNAKRSVYENLKRLYIEIKKGKKIDFVAIIRGGGGSYGILWQNDYDIAKAICYMPAPVIVAVGHTSDKFVLDQVANISAKTPTEAAHILIKLVKDYEENINNWIRQVNKKLVLKLKEYDKEVDYLLQSINESLKHKIDFYNHTLDLYFNTISAFGIKKLVKRGFALLADPEDGQILTKKDIQNLEPGKQIDILVYDKKIRVKLIDISNIGQNLEFN